MAQRIVDHGALRGDEVVLEVGPGRGVLTRLLAARAAKVVAIEKDPRMVDHLEDAGLPDNVKLVLGDALKVDWPRFDKIVSNLPYGISSDVTFRLLDQSFELGVLTYQREFAQRMGAAPGTEHYGRLSVNAFVKAEVTPLEHIPPAAFRPMPRVASLAVRLVPRATPPFPIQDPVLFAAVVRAGFQHRRKTMRNALLDQSEDLGLEREALREAVPSIPHMEDRAEVLEPEAFEAVARALRERALARPKAGKTGAAAGR